MLPQARNTTLAYLGIAALLLVLTVILPASGVWERRGLPVVHEVIREARVVEVTPGEDIPTPGGVIRQQRVIVEVEGERFAVDRTYQAASADAFEVKVGETVLLGAAEGEQGTVYQLRDRARRIPVWTLTLAFALLVVIVGGTRGAMSLVGLASSVIVIARFIVPAIMSGWDPLLVCIFGALVIMATTLTLGHGVERKTAVALGATFGCLVLTGLLAVGAVGFAHLSGMATDDASTLQVLLGPGIIDARGLLLGSMILGAVGVLDDVTTTQASAIAELHEANPSLSRQELFRRGMNVGRDHIAATTNTLLLAYAGTALPLILILAAQQQPTGILVSFDALATEVVRTVVGSIGIVAAVPVTTALAAAVAGGARARAR
ncbi:MAG: YibE/F family protein [Dehalococcoidia bacterium]|nr:MAG: YibE/F family protein [Dehalococcoidia bacterium]